MEDSCEKIPAVLAKVEAKQLGKITLLIAGHTNTRGSDGPDLNPSRGRTPDLRLVHEARPVHPDGARGVRGDRGHALRCALSWSMFSEKGERELPSLVGDGLTVTGMSRFRKAVSHWKEAKLHVFPL